MIRAGHMKARGAGTVAVIAASVLLTGLAACSSANLLSGSSPAPNETQSGIMAAEPTPPPIDLAGRWQLSAAAGGACTMNFGDTPSPAGGAAFQGTIAPGGGCPGSFFMSRKWVFENSMLVIHDFKGKTLAQLSYVGGHFEGHDHSGSALTLSKQL
jgi:Protease inhibitor Inh